MTGLAARAVWLVAASGLLTATALAVGLFSVRCLTGCFRISGTRRAACPFYTGGLSSFAADAVSDTRRAFAYDALSYNFSAVAGPALVAIMAALLPAQASLGVVAGTAALGATSASAFGLRPRTVVGAVSPWRAVGADLHRIFRHRPLATVTAASTLTQIGQGGLAIAAVALSIERGGSPGQGAFLFTAFAVGSLLGALCEVVRPTRTRPHMIMVAGIFMTG